MNLSVLKFELIENVAVITMNNPPVNALEPAFLDDFKKIFNKIKSKNPRAVLIASKCPGFFSAGDDISTLKDISDITINLLPEAHALLNEFENLPLPVVAAINGHALGGGLELALTCDFRFMGADSGRIGLPEVRLGMIPSIGGTQRLPQMIGRARAIEMMYKGLQITPEEAKNIGLVNDIFPKEDLYEKSLDYAARLSRQATGAIARIKRCVNELYAEGFQAGLSMERQAFKENIRSHDAIEGVDAFLSNRKPEFKGR